MVMTSQENNSQMPSSTKSADVLEKNPEHVKEINDTFAEGYRLFIAKDYENAAEHLVKANQASVSLYGQFAPECFKPHYYYGLCMLEIAQSTIENQVVPIVDAPIDEEDDEEAEQVEEDGEVEPIPDEKTNYKPLDDNNEAESVAVKLNENYANREKAADSDASSKFGPVVVEEADSPTKTVKTAENGDDSDHSDKVGSTTRDEAAAVAADETLKDEEEEGADGEDEDEEDLPAERLAWESLEVARKICEKLETQVDGAAAAEWMERRAEVLSACSECQILIEQYEQALTDLETVLELQKRLFKPHDRRIAQTYYNMGRCHRNANDFERAAVAFQEAGRQLQNLIDYIREQGDAATEAERKTADEMAEMIVEVAAQAQDAIESAKARAEQIDEQRQIVTDVFKKVIDTVEVPADDITAQIRHRRSGTSSEVPTNNAGAGATTDTVDATSAGGMTAATTTTDVLTGASIDMEEEEPKAVGAAGDGSASASQGTAVKRSATVADGNEANAAKKVKLAEVGAMASTEAN